MTVEVTLRGGADLASFLAAAERIANANVGRIAVIGGVAVTCRLETVHRATTDVDAVAEERTPAVIEVLLGLEGASTAQRPDRVIVDGVPIDVLPTVPVGDVRDLDLPDRLFLLSHRFALETATLLHVTVLGHDRPGGTLPIATPAGLVATKLGGFLGRTGQSRATKRPTDAYDLYRLLLDLDDDGQVGEALATSLRLAEAVRDAARLVLVADTTRTLQEIRRIGDPVSRSVTEDDLAFVGERLVERLSDSP